MKAFDLSYAIQLICSMELSLINHQTRSRIGSALNVTYCQGTRKVKRQISNLTELRNALEAKSSTSQSYKKKTADILSIAYIYALTADFRLQCIDLKEKYPDKRRVLACVVSDYQKAQNLAIDHTRNCPELSPFILLQFYYIAANCGLKLVDIYKAHFKNKLQITKQINDTISLLEAGLVVMRGDSIQTDLNEAMEILAQFHGIMCAELAQLDLPMKSALNGQKKSDQTL